MNIKNGTGYYIAYGGVFILFLWIGIFKFTSIAAYAIKPLVENQPLTAWLYDLFSVRAVSNLIGSFELLTAVMMILAIWGRTARKIAAFMFLFTLSFLFTSPGVWRVVEGVPITDFFILKDLPLLGVGFMLLENEQKEYLCHR